MLMYGTYIYMFYSDSLQFLKAECEYYRVEAERYQKRISELEKRNNCTYFFDSKNFDIRSNHLLTERKNEGMVEGYNY
jgi:hypothetical protein